MTGDMDGFSYPITSRCAGSKCDIFGFSLDVMFHLLCNLARIQAGSDER